MNKNKLIPELRFPEFENEGEWKNDIVDNLVLTVTPPKKLTSSNYQLNGKFPIIDQSKSFYCGWTNDEDAVIYNDFPLVIFGDHTCILKLAKEPFAQGADGIKILKAKSQILTEYLFHYLQYNEVKMEDYKRHFSILKDKIVAFPKIENEEQHKIASCLSSLDEVMAAHSQKLELLKDHKKGLMQNLFPQEGEKVPKVRFKEFEKDGDWVEKTIDSIKSILTDYVANGSFQSLRENLNVVDSIDYAFYVRLTDLRAGLGHSNQKYVDESTYNFLNKSALCGGELLMANIGANVGEVWQMPYTNKPSTLAPNMLMIKFKKEVDSGFVYQFFTSNQGIISISKAISGSGHPKISKTDLRQVLVSLPPTALEQQKIASCLSSLDALISAQAEKIDQLKLHKKGIDAGVVSEN